GAWAPRLVPGLPVRVTRETVAYFNRPGPPTPSIGELDVVTRGHAMYALHDPVHGLKAGAHHAGHETDPDSGEPADPQVVERIVDWVRARFPGVDPEPAGSESCLYTNTEDESFVLERKEWVPDEHAHRHFKTFDVKPAGDAVTGRRVLMWNDDVEISLCRPEERMDYFFRNGEGDEVIFVHEGSGTLETVFGDVPYK